MISCDFLGLSSPFLVDMFAGGSPAQIVQGFDGFFAFQSLFGGCPAQIVYVLSWVLLCFLSFCGLSSSDCVGFIMGWLVCASFFGGAVQPRLYRFWRFLACVCFIFFLGGRPAQIV